MTSDVQYNLAAIRELLLAAFTAETLRRFCQDRTFLQPVLKEFAPEQGLNTMVDRVIDFCETRYLWDRFLPEVRRDCPRQYARFEDELGVPAVAYDDVPCPYRGLEPFQAEHAEFFFGRQAMVERLVDKVRNCRLVAVVGASGSGKSSLVRAGLVTALREGALPGSKDWVECIFRPGPKPLRALCAPLVEMLEPEATEVTRLAEGRALADHLREGSLSMGDVAGRLRDKYPEIPRFLLVADQFEELYTECHEEGEWEAFVGVLLAASEQENMSVVLTLRGDFYGRVLGNLDLGQAVDKGLANVLPMSEEELQAAIEEPALRTGREFEPGLVARILEDVVGQPGNLPLMEFALTEMWEWQADDRRLTHSAYDAIGEVEGAIALRAEATYKELAEQGLGETVQRIFLQLTHYGERTEGTRRQAMVDELVTPRTSRGDVESTVKALADARLLVTGGEAPQKATAEVAHEALIRGWERLGRWLDEDRAFGLWRERLAAARQTWQETGRDEGVLLRGAPLAEAEGWLAGRRDDLNEAEQAFIEEGLALREREAAEREAQRQRELDAAQKLAEEQGRRAEAERQRAEEQTRGTKRLRRLVVVLAAVFVLAVGAAVVAGMQTEVANRNAATAVAHAKGEATARAEVEAERDRAEHETRLASSRELATSALLQLSVDPELGLLLAMEANKIAQTLQAEQALRRSLLESRVRAVMREHKGMVHSAVFSPDGKRVLTASEDGTARVWEASTGRSIVELRGHESAVYSAVFSPDGKLAITASRDGTARIWQTETGQSVAELSGHGGSVLSAEFSPDGKLVVTASGDGTARIWEVSTGQTVAVLQGHTGPVNSAKFSPDGKLVVTTGGWGSRLEGGRLVAASPDTTARIWEVATGKELVLLSHGDWVTGAAFDPDGYYVVTSSADGTARVSEVSTGSIEAIMRGHVDWVTSAAFQPGGSHVVTSSADGTVRAWARGQTVAELRGHTSDVNTAAFSPNGRFVVSAGGDATARVWDFDWVSSYGRGPVVRQVAVLRGHTGSVTDVAFSPDGRYVVTASADTTARLWEIPSGEPIAIVEGSLRALSPDFRFMVTAIDSLARVSEVVSGRLVAELSGHTGQVTNVAFSPDGSRVATTSADETTRMWDAVTGRELVTLRGHTDQGTYVVFSPDGNMLATSREDGNTRVWEASTGNLLVELDGEFSMFSPDGGLVVTTDSGLVLTTGADDTARVWEVATGNLAMEMEGESPELTFSPDGRYLVVSSGLRRYPVVSTITPQVWEAATGKLLAELRGHWRTVLDVTFSPDGRYIATASEDNTARIWETATGKSVAELRGHTFYVKSVTFSPDGELVVTSSADTTARLWNARSGRELMILRGHNGQLTGAVFSPNGKYVATGGQWDMTARVWEVSTGALVDVLYGHDWSVGRPTFSSDGRYILTFGSKALVHACEVCGPFDYLLDLAPTRVTRELICEERQTYLGEDTDCPTPTPMPVSES